MISDALALASRQREPAQRLNVLREYLQAQILYSLYESLAFTSLSFVGGTALRFVYDLPRFSEDLDFSCENPQNYDPQTWLKKLDRFLKMSGYDAVVSWNDRRTVHTGSVRFGGLLSELELTSDPRRKLSVRLKIDTSPPQGAATQRSIVQRHAITALQHHDLPSLMAGKINALLTRCFTKGRDWYDLLWYLSRSPAVQPNETLLQNALQQFGTVNHSQPWQQLLLATIPEADFPAAAREVSPFLERPHEAALITAEHISSLLAETR